MPSPTTISPWKRLYDDVKINIPGATDAVMQQELFRVFKDFCDQTNLWTEDIPFTATPNVFSYPLTVAGKGVPNRLLIVFDPAQQHPAQHWTQGGISMQMPGIIVIQNSVSSAVPWIATVAKTPTDPVDANNYPEIDPAFQWLIDKYRDCFFYGMLARLMMQPSKTYSNPKSAAMNYAQYTSQRSKARTDGIKANTFGGQRWTFPQNYATTMRKGWI